MSKSILVIDTPESCLKCEFYDRRLDGTLRCTRNKDSSNVVFGLSKDESCPLKEIPQKMAEENRWFSVEYAQGYNACIDEILKERD